MSEVMLFVARHGRTLFNQAGRGQGWCDSPLLPEGEAVARALGRGLRKAGVRFDAAWAGDLLRQRRTARLALDAMGLSALPVREDADLREVCFGSFEGEDEHRRDALFLREAGLTDPLDLFRSGVDRFTDLCRKFDTTGMAEDAETVRRRMAAAIDRIARAASDGQRVLIVSSGMSINCWLDTFCGAHGPLANASVTRVRWTDGALTPLGIGETRFFEDGMEDSHD